MVKFSDQVMESYVLLLHVTVEEEIAIQDLYRQNGWFFDKRGTYSTWGPPLIASYHVSDPISTPSLQASHPTQHQDNTNSTSVTDRSDQCPDVHCGQSNTDRSQSGGRTYTEHHNHEGSQDSTLSQGHGVSSGTVYNSSETKIIQIEEETQIRSTEPQSSLVSLNRVSSVKDSSYPGARCEAGHQTKVVLRNSAETGQNMQRKLNCDSTPVQRCLDVSSHSEKNFHCPQNDNRVASLTSFNNQQSETEACIEQGSRAVSPAESTTDDLHLDLLSDLICFEKKTLEKSVKGLRTSSKEEEKGKEKSSLVNNCQVKQTQNSLIYEINKIPEETSCSSITQIEDKHELGKGSYHCIDCDVTFTFAKRFNTHKRNGQCKFPCSFCGKVFITRDWSKYQMHLAYHRNERPYKCTVCEKSYNDRSKLTLHMRNHTGERPYVCHVCGSQFTQGILLRQHIRNMHEDHQTRYDCEVCGSEFKNEGYLKYHMKIIHSNHRPYVCEICNKQFKTKYVYSTHLETHEETGGFKCDTCSKTFKRKSYLTSHQRRHNKQHHLFCASCGKGFYEKSKLMDHQRLHSGEKPFKCQFCDYCCAISGNLKKHMRTHETMEVETREVETREVESPEYQGTHIDRQKNTETGAWSSTTDNGYTITIL